jgi:hypothetical protein
LERSPRSARVAAERGDRKMYEARAMPGVARRRGGRGSR